MTQQQGSGFKVGGNKLWLGLVVLILAFFALFFVAKGLFWLLNILAPILLIATLIIDHKVVTGYVKMIWNLLKTNTLVGVGASLLTFFGYPFVSGYLFSKAILKKQLKKFEQTHGTGRIKKAVEFTEYEEVEDEILDEKPLELPEIDQTMEELRNEYDDLFGNGNT